MRSLALIFRQQAKLLKASFVTARWDGGLVATWSDGRVTVSDASALERGIDPAECTLELIEQRIAELGEALGPERVAELERVLDAGRGPNGQTAVHHLMIDGFFDDERGPDS